MNRPTGLHILIRESAGGDEQAQANLYITVYQPLFQHIVNRFKPAITQEDAQEIVQQTIVQMYIHASHFTGAHDEASAWQWAYKIARNQAFKWLRTINKTVSIWETCRDDIEKDEAALFDVLFLSQSPFSPEDALEEQVTRKLIWEAAQRTFSELTEREQEFILLRYEQNYTLEEIAQKFHIKRPRVHQVLAAIHHKLRKSAKLDEL